MKKILAIGLGVFVLLGGVVYAVGPDTIYGKFVRLKCLHISYSESCQTQILNAGHWLFANGKHFEAVVFYEIPAIMQKPEGLFHHAWGWFYIDALLDTKNKAIAHTIVSDIRKYAGSGNYEREAFLHLSFAAKAGFAPAMNNLGQFHYFGIGRPLDKKEAFKWHLAAAEAGNPIAAANVRLAYLNGDGVERNEAEAEKWATLSFENTDPTDISSPVLQRTLLHGSVLPKHEIEAIQNAARLKTPLPFTFIPPEGGHPLQTVLLAQ